MFCERRKRLGIQTRLQPYPTTALGASEVNLLELANAYRTMASGMSAEPYVIRKIVSDSGEVVADNEHAGTPVDVDDCRARARFRKAFAVSCVCPPARLIRLTRAVSRLAVMGKTGTTNEFRDALFVGSTFGLEGITVAVRIGFDDNRSLGTTETGGRVALPVFKELMLRVYREKLVGPAPTFPAQMEQNINDYLAGGSIAKGESVTVPNASNPPAPFSVRFTDRGEAIQERP